MASRRDGPGPRGLLAPPLLLLLLPPLLAPWPAAGHGGKYSREKNEPERPPQREPAAEFRMEKLNQLWDKAQRLQLSPVDLSELHADLKIQERDEFAWKKLKAEGLDEDGEKEAKLIRNLNEPLPPNERVLVRDPLQPHPACGHISPPGNGLQVLAVKLVCDRDHTVILAKYRLDGRKDARALSSNSLTEGPEQDSLEDPRLEKLWHKAKTSGKFSRDELDKLWREFQHHREKVQEYNVLLETLSRTEEIQENAINPSDMRRAQEEVLHSRHAELKDRLRRINQGYDRLRKVSHQGYGAEAEFEEPRVIDLWDLAQSANFSEKELEAFREELKHFEVKIEKHNHYQKQLEISHQKLRHVERFGDHEHLSRNKERYALLEEKTKELGYKVKKHLQDLSGRISRARHNEL